MYASTLCTVFFGKHSDLFEAVAEHVCTNLKTKGQALNMFALKFWELSAELIKRRQAATRQHQTRVKQKKVKASLQEVPQTPKLSNAESEYPAGGIASAGGRADAAVAGCAE